VPRHKPLDDDVKAATAFAGIVNAKRTKDIGYKALTIGRNVEITDTQKLTRRSGATQTDAAVFTGLYGTDAQTKQYAVRAGSLVDIARNGTQTTLQTGLLGSVFSWDEDPNNNVYYCSDQGSNGLVTQDGIWLPLSLPVPTISSVAVIDPGTWEAKPFSLGLKYSQSPRIRMQLLATYVMADGRETAPSETVSVAIAPEVRMLRIVVPVGGVQTRIYATAPGGSTYYLVGITSNPTVTVLVKNMNWTATGVVYPYTTSVSSFPADASLLCFFHGRLYAAVYDPTTGMGTIYASLPMQ